ncbi:MAG: carboxyl transferase domain-containing protein [Kiloniellales bacterium]
MPAGRRRVRLPSLRLSDAAGQRCRFSSRVTEEYRKLFANPFVAASRGFIDDVIMPHGTRRRICGALKMLENKQVADPWKKHDNLPL